MVLRKRSYRVHNDYDDDITDHCHHLHCHHLQYNHLQRHLHHCHDLAIRLRARIRTAGAPVVPCQSRVVLLARATWMHHNIVYLAAL